MTTKEQERKALAQIQKIVAGLGENSYIGVAFEGCFEIAEENITNDFGCSMKQRAESAEREAAEQKKLANKYMAEYKALSEKKREMSAELDSKLNEIDYHKATIKAMEQEAKMGQEKTDKALTDLADKLLEKGEEVEDFKAKAEYYGNRVNELNKELETTVDRAVEAQEANRQKDAKIEALELEVIRLKARLFDLIDKQ